MRRTALLCTLFLLWSAAPASAHGQGPSTLGVARDTARRAERSTPLAGLARVWAALRFTHPFVAYRTDVDVDSAAVAALGAMIGARTALDSARALEGMVASIDDPATRVLGAANGPDRWPTASARGLEATLRPDSVLVIAIHQYARISVAGSLFDPERHVATVAGQLRAARAVVIDLRTDATPARHPDDRVLLADVVTRVLQHTTTRTVTPPAHRNVVWTAFSETEPWGGVGSWAFLQTGQVVVVRSIREARDLPVVLLANRNSELPAYAGALVREGTAALVTEGDLGDAPFVRYRDVDAGGLRVRVRLTELVDAEGRGTAPPTVVVSPGGVMNGMGDEAMERALALTRAPQSVRGTPGAALPAVPRLRPPPQNWTMSEATTLPPPGARLFALVKVWGTIATFFPRIDARLGRPWDGVLAEFMAPLRDAASVTDYHLALARLLNRLQDSHTSLNTVPLADWRGRAVLPFRLAVVRGRLVVTEVNHDSLLAGARVRPGDIVRSIDGEDALARGRRVAETFSSSTRTRADAQAATYARTGPPGSSAVVVLEDLAGRTHTVTLRRHPGGMLRADRESRLPPAIRHLTPEIGYIDPSRIHPDSVDHALDQVRDTRALILEWRDGIVATAYPFVARLSRPDSVLQMSTGTWVNVDGTGRTRAVTAESWCVCRHPTRHYAGLTVLVTGPGVQSFMEVNADLLRRGNGTPFVGASTGGVLTGASVLYLPGGIRISPSSGPGPSSTGLVPDIPVEPTRAGLRAQRDEVLEAAVAYLRRRLARQPSVGASHRPPDPASTGKVPDKS